MPIPLLTARTIVETKSAIDGLSEDVTKEAHQRFKNLNRKGFFESEEDPNKTATSANLFHKREMGRAAILLDIVEAGIDGAMLRSIADALRAKPRLDFGHAPSADVGGSHVYGSGLDAAIAGALKNDPGRWILTFSASRDGDRVVHIAHVIYLPEGEHLDDDLPSLRRPMVSGFIDLTARLKPFGRLLNEA